MPIAARCSVISTSSVAARTTLLIARFRFHLKVRGRGGESLLCEEILPLAFTGQINSPQWLSTDAAEHLLNAQPERNLLPTAIDQQLGLLLPKLPQLQTSLEEQANERAAVQLEAHERVREAARSKGRVVIEPVLPVDILGAYVLLPRLN